MEANEKIIDLESMGYDIAITLVDPELGEHGDVRWGGGSIGSSMKEVCPHCLDIECEMDCTESQSCEPTEKELEEYVQERISFNKHRAAIDAIESLILAHAIAGIDVESPAYLEGLETVQNALMNNL